VLHLTLTPIDDFAALGRRWQALEKAAPAGFFRSWTFLGCQAETRFAGARLLAATRDGEDVALALLGQGAGRTWLNETGNPVADSVFIEHNGLLLRTGHEHAIAPTLLFARQNAAPLMLSGIDHATLRAAQTLGWCTLHQTRFAPCVNLAGLQTPYLESLSANARAQIRRSMRLYGETLRIDRADTLPQAIAWFTEMATLHQSAWQRRGKPGAFAHPAIIEFHMSLLDRGWKNQTVELLRISAQEKTIGILYNFIEADRVLLYQSGFAYTDNPRFKPGLTCHSLAIETYIARGMQTYDLLAGDDRYKTSLSNAGENLHWAVLHKPWSMTGIKEESASFLKKRSKKLLRL
jgi:CelD/BcsL family acetyltransferase involved in cellulose biosynthesis